jgi:diketogulonate reductase-like aldo/keto reductase
LNTDYLDLVLLHGPTNTLPNDWKTMVDIYTKTIDINVNVKHVGVSNYNIDNLKTILESSDIKPYVNQIEITPFLQRKQLIKFCFDNEIIVVSHSSLTKGIKLNNSIILDIAKKYKTSASTILLNWCCIKGLKIIPRTSNIDHLVENMTIIKIKNEDIIILDSLDENFATHTKYIQ